MLRAFYPNLVTPRLINSRRNICPPGVDNQNQFHLLTFCDMNAILHPHYFISEYMIRKLFNPCAVITSVEHMFYIYNTWPSFSWDLEECWLACAHNAYGTLLWFMWAWVSQPAVCACVGGEEQRTKKPFSRFLLTHQSFQSTKYPKEGKMHLWFL